MWHWCRNGPIGRGGECFRKPHPNPSPCGEGLNAKIGYMAVRYRGEIVSYSGVVWRVDIHDTQYTGAATDCRIDNPVVSYNGGGEPHSPIMPSVLTFGYVVGDEDEEDFMIEIITNSDENRYLVALYRDGSYTWGGGIVADQMTWDDAAYPFIYSITATDGLALLKEKNWDVGPADSESRIRLREIVRRALILTPMAGLYADTAGFVRWFSSIRENSQSTAATETSGEAWVRKRRTFDISKTGTRENKTAWYWLEQVLQLLCCRLYQSGGVWVVEEIPYRRNVSVKSVLLTKNGVSGVAVPLATLDVALSQVSNAARRLGRWGVLPEAGRVTLKLQREVYTNMIAGMNFSQAAIGPTNSDIEVNPVPLVSSLVVKGKLTITVTNVDLATPPNYAVVWGITIRVGAKWYVRSAQVSGFQYSYGAANWQSSAGTYAIVQGMYLAPPIGGGGGGMGAQATNVLDFQIDVPAIADAGEFHFGVRVLSLRRANTGGVIDPASLTHVFNLTNQSAYVLEGGVIQNDAAYEAYYTESATGNSKRYELESVLGDGEAAMLGSLWLPQTELTSSWTSDGDTVPKTIQHLCVSEIMRLYKSRMLLYQGDVISNTYLPHYRLGIAGAYYLLMSGKHDLARDEWQGCEFFRIQRAAGDIIIVDEGIDDINLVAPPTDTVVGVQAADVLNYGTTVAGFLKATTLATAVPAGSVTTLSVTNYLKAKALKTGQKILLVNPMSGAAETLTVTADTATPDTGFPPEPIAVSGTLAYDYPVDSFIVPPVSAAYVEGEVAGGSASAAALPEYDSNDAAVAGGLVAGDEYRAGSGHEAAARGTRLVVF